MCDRTGALFIDFENLYYAVRNGPLRIGTNQALSFSMDALQDVRKQLANKERVTLVIERCYGDWEKLPETTQRQLAISGIIPRFVDSRVDKSTADIEMSLDILHTSMSREEIGVFVVVGGDRDYLPVLRRLKEARRTIIICAPSRTLSGDVREFVENYGLSAIWELDEQVGEGEPFEAAKVVERPNNKASVEVDHADSSSAPNSKSSRTRLHEWHERYVKTMQDFMTENDYVEIHLGPFFRWLRSSEQFELMKFRDVRSLLQDLVDEGVVSIEEREGVQGYPFSVATLNRLHPFLERALS